LPDVFEDCEAPLLRGLNTKRNISERDNIGDFRSNRLGPF